MNYLYQDHLGLAEGAVSAPAPAPQSSTMSDNFKGAAQVAGALIDAAPILRSAFSRDKKKKKPKAPPPVYMPPPKNYTKPVLLGVGVIVAGLVGFILYRKFKKK
jgi:hypothetical protein